MNLKSYVIRDAKTKQYRGPYFYPNEPVMRRDMITLVNQTDAQSHLALYPDDFSVYYLGDFDTEKAKFELVVEPEFLFKLSDLKEKDA